MKIEQIYTSCLAEAAYYIESDGEAVIIDPMRETEPYLERVKSDGAQVKYVFETHFHADFVSGHLDLAKKTGATIVYGPTAKPNFEIHQAKDGEVFNIGKIQIVALHTPGHTMESTSYLLIDEKGKEHALFSGDALFIGDVGRPDLAIKTDLTREDLAGFLFDSLRNKIMTLPDDVIIYPNHGAGSACGKKMSAETWDTLGNQKKTNYALRSDMTREEFIKEVTEGLVDPPQYFPKNALMNKMGYESLDSVREKGETALSVDAFKIAQEAEEALIIDTRSRQDFPKGFIPGSIFIGIDDNFAPWVGALITDLNQPILFICDEGHEEEVVTRLSRVGYDNSIGYLKGGMEAWIEAGEPIDSLDEIEASDFVRDYKQQKQMNVLDTRKCSEYKSEHVVNAYNFPLDFINRNMAEVDPKKEYFLYCKSGYRSVIAASILKARGFEKLVNVRGGFEALQRFGVPATEFHEPTTLL